MVREPTPRLVQVPALGNPRRSLLDVRSEALSKAPAVDLRIVTIDKEGRLPLGRGSETMAWEPHMAIMLTVHDGIIRLIDPNRLSGRHPLGVPVRLDGRRRVQIPFGIRVAAGLQPGTRLILMAASSDGVLAAFPVSTLIQRLTTGL